MSTDELRLTLQSKAFSFRSKEVQKIELCLEHCVDDKERIDFLEANLCDYRTKLHELPFWYKGSLVRSNEDLWWTCLHSSFPELAEVWANDPHFVEDYKFQESYLCWWQEGWTFNWMINWISQQIANICNFRILAEDKPNREEKLHPLVYWSFEDLFVKPDEVDLHIKTLQNYNPENPLLGDNLQWIGGDRNKYVVVAWINQLHALEKIYSHQYDEVIPALKATFTGLNIAKRTFLDRVKGYEQAKKYFAINIRR
ncbi:hypothetical protein [Spirosoma rigui]|uniref:hypothetical protein n=1 Tax=Spirosoma rigui TaxID=564064 RepID=UPI0009B09D13|nr:hypothetical protein [Spirosoma rigui]